MRLDNSFEGGAPGQPITPANSGGASGDAFTDVAANPEPVYSSAQAAHGTLSAEVPPGDSIWLSWVGLVSGTGDRWGRAYVWTGQGDDVVVALVFEDAQFVTYAVSITIIDDDAHLELIGWDDERDVVDEAIVEWPAEQWVRLECRVNNDNRTLEARIYFTADSPNPDVVLSGTTTQRAGAWNDFYVLAQTHDAELYLDDIAYSDEGWIGPEATLVDTSASDAATTTDTSLVDRTILVADADTGTLQEAADASTAGLAIPATDQAATYETAAITAAAGTADIAALTQHAAVTAAPSSDDTPAAVLAETTGVTAVAAGGDTGSLDEASALEQRHTGTDQATLSETTDLEQTTGPVVVDLAAFADLEAVGAALTAADAALVDDLVSLAEYRTDADQATLADISALAVVTGDIGLVGEHAVSAATFDRVDTAVLLEALHVLQPTAAADAAVFTDHAIVRMVGSPTGVGHPYTDWTASTPYT